MINKCDGEYALVDCNWDDSDVLMTSIRSALLMSIGLSGLGAQVIASYNPVSQIIFNQLPNDERLQEIGLIYKVTPWWVQSLNLQSFSQNTFSLNPDPRTTWCTVPNWPLKVLTITILLKTWVAHIYKQELQITTSPSDQALHTLNKVLHVVRGSADIQAEWFS